VSSPNRPPNFRDKSQPQMAGSHRATRLSLCDADDGSDMIGKTASIVIFASSREDNFNGAIDASRTVGINLVRVKPGAACYRGCGVDGVT
jgi:hypothetical protein